MLGEWIDNEHAKYEHINEPNRPEGPKNHLRPGSMEWQAQVEKAVKDRKAAAEEEENKTLSRLAAFLGKKA